MKVVMVYQNSDEVNYARFILLSVNEHSISHLSFVENWDNVCYLKLINKHVLLVLSKFHYCDDSCFISCLFADFTQCLCVASLQRSCCIKNNWKIMISKHVLLVYESQVRLKLKLSMFITQLCKSMFLLAQIFFSPFYCLCVTSMSHHLPTSTFHKSY